MSEETTSCRLKRRIHAKGWSVRQFQMAVKAAAPDARGVSYASVYEHVKGKAKHEPPLAFLRVAAQVLDVPLAWLVCEAVSVGAAHVEVRVFGHRYLVTDITDAGDMVLRRVDPRSQDGGG